MHYQGSCHCGNIRFTVQGDIDQALSCNCSICQRKGSLLWFTAFNQLELLTPVENISTYTFNKHVIQHHFCANCGIHPFGEGADPKGNHIAAINIRCLEDFDLKSIQINDYDGKSV